MKWGILNTKFIFHLKRSLIFIHYANYFSGSSVGYFTKNSIISFILMICCFIFSYHHSVRSFSCFLYCENSLSREIVQQKNISLAFFLLSAEKFIKISTFWKYHKYSSFSYASFLFLTFSAKKSFFFFFSALTGWRRIIVFFNNRNFRLNCLRIHQILWLVEGKNYSRLRRLNSTIFFFFAL